LSDQLKFDEKENRVINQLDFSEKAVPAAGRDNTAEENKLENHLLAESFNRFPTAADVAKVERQSKALE
jgi:hypothetical protein